MNNRRYEIELCVGCIGINDTAHPQHGQTGPGYHRDDADVVAFWLGKQDENENWYIPDQILREAGRVCDLLNELNDAREEAANNALAEIKAFLDGEKQ